MKSKKFFLVGMPASGKSTIGKLLAKQLGTNFIDLDDKIVEKEGISISEIFNTRGEEYFREIERDQLHNIIEQNAGFVLATGGGTPCFFDNMLQMNNLGVTIFINVPLEELYYKLAKKGIQKRPLLKDISKEDLHFELKSKFERRKFFYKQSKICLEQKFGEITNRVNQVIFAIKNLEEKSN